MLHTKRASRGIVTAPHNLASQAGLSVLRDGGNAIEAMVAAAAAIAVVYPHMNAIGGDGFWIVHEPGSPPVGIDACGAAGADVNDSLYAGMEAIPSRGPLAANTVAGAISGWRAALEISANWGGNLSLDRLLEDAIWYGREGFPLSGNQFRTVEQKRDELKSVSGFADLYLSDNVEGAKFRNPRLANTLSSLARDGLDGFYRGALADRIAADLESAGSPITKDDLAAHQAQIVTPLSVKLSSGMVYNMPPPTQGVASLMILALFDRLRVSNPDGFAHIHGLVEATKQAFLLRDAHVTDPDYMTADPADWLSEGFLVTAGNSIDPTRALPWPQTDPTGGDTIWMGAIDNEGRAVSYIQSIYWEFGSGVVLEDTGISWQNRGSSFSLTEGARNRLMPRRKPFHTLNPALALLGDGRTLAYGTMGGEGQPQTQAAVFTRHVNFGQDLQQSITAPRWLLGRTWGDETMTLKLESRFDVGLVEALRNAGHNTEIVEPFSDLMGHAGAVVRHPDGSLEGATDPRSDGGVAGF
jgi:oxamate amidohydrolase